MATLGRHISVRGPTGSGKTTLAPKLGKLLGLPTIDLDEIAWEDNWQSKSSEAMRAAVAAWIEEHADGWVIAGNYSGAGVADLVLSKADSVVWLLPPPRITFFRLFRRSIRRAVTRERLWGTNNVESLRRSFFSKDSIPLWSLKSYRRQMRGNLARQAKWPNQPWFTLRSLKEVSEFLATLERDR